MQSMYAAFIAVWSLLNSRSKRKHEKYFCAFRVRFIVTAGFRDVVVWTLFFFFHYVSRSVLPGRRHLGSSSSATETCCQIATCIPVACQTTIYLTAGLIHKFHQQSASAIATSSVLAFMGSVWLDALTAAANESLTYFTKLYIITIENAGKKKNLILMASVVGELKGFRLK